jgi:spore germination protein YaaH
MSKHRLRHFVGALICGVVPLIALIPVGPVQASSPPHAARPAAAIAPESAALRKFRDSASPTMAAAAQFEATAPIHTYAPLALAKTTSVQDVSNPRMFREVFGFAFASSLGDPTVGYPSWNMSLLSTVAYFGVHVTWSGDFSDDSALSIWNDPYGPVPGLIQTAHANGTKVVLTLIMFDSTYGTPNMCSALQAPRSTLTIQRTVAQVADKGIDGVNIDYESNNTNCTDPSTGAVQSSQSLFTTFVKNMRAALPSSYISVDTYSGSAGFRDCSTCPFLGFFDIAALASYADSFFVMAYDMEYANWDSPPLSCPSFCIGPTSPLSTYLFNQGRASSEYRAVVPGSKVIMGMPYYGRKVCVAGYTPSNAPENAVASTQAVADGYLDASTENGYVYNSDYHIHRVTRDAGSATRWDTWTSSTAGCTREMYWDDATALGNKYDLVIRDGLRGAGIFALNYGGGAPELWNMILSKFGQCSAGAISADKPTPQIPGAAITFTGSAFCAGTPEYQFYLQPPGGAWAVARAYSTTSTWTWNTASNTPLGTYSVQVAARNAGSSVTYDTVATISFRLARCSTPSLTADHASPQLPSTQVVFTAVGTCSGTPEYQFSETSPGGTTSVVEPYSPTATYAWNTTSNPYGAYIFSVDVRVKSVSSASEASQSMPFSLTSCSGAAFTTDKTSPQPTGSQVLLTGSATCVGAPQYRFMIQPPGGAYAVVQDFSASSTFTWVGNGVGGTYGLELDAKGGAAAPNTMQSVQLSFVLTACSAVTLATSPAPPQTPGATVVLTAAATCPGTPQYRFSIAKPNQSYGVVQDYGSASTYSWNTTGQPLGGYGLRAEVRNVGATTAAEASASVTFTLANPACTAPTLTANPPSPQGPSTMVTFTATTTICPSPLYRFYYQTPGAGWTLLQDYSTSRTYTWSTAGAPGGNYNFEVDVRDSTRPVSYDQYTVVPFVINACTGATLSPSVPSPQFVGTQIVVTASASASFCPNPRYQFWILPPGGSWTVAQAYSSSATFNWNTTGDAVGNYYVSVWVRDASSVGASYDTYVPGIPYTLTSGACTSVTASAAPASPQTAGTPVAITASASGCPNPRYEFWLLTPGGSWTIAQAYSASATFNWNTTPPAGIYRYSVWVRDASSAAAYDSYLPGIAFTLTSATCTSVAASAAPASPQAAGTLVTISASASGCPNARYEFWILSPGGSWTIAQGYSSSATFNWNTNPHAGTYSYSVWVRDVSSSAAYDAFVPGTVYTLTTTPCTSVTASAAPTSPQAHGTTITITASASGCTNPRYEFWLLAPGGSWTIVQAYSGNASFSWNTTGLPAGTYRYSVWVRDASSAAAYDAYFPGTSYTLT